MRTSNVTVLPAFVSDVWLTNCLWSSFETETIFHVFIFCGAEGRTQDLGHAWQALYHRVQSSLCGVLLKTYLKLIPWKVHICVQCVLIIYTPHHPLTAPISTFWALTSCPLFCCCCFSNPFSSVSWVWGHPLEWEHQWRRIVGVLLHIAVFFIQILQQNSIFSYLFYCRINEWHTWSFT